MLNKVFQAIERTKLNITGWFVTFIGILFIRFWFESYSSPPLIGGVTINFLTGIHFALFFIATEFLILIILCLIAPRHRLLSLKVALYGIGLILLAPLFDLLFTGGRGLPLLYIVDATHSIWFNFFTYFGPNLSNGATLGIRIEVAIVMLVAGIYIWHCTGSWIKSIGSALLAYTAIFFCGALPLIIATLVNGHTITPSEFSDFYLFAIKDSALVHTLIEPMYVFKNLQGLLGMFFNSVVGQFFLFLSIISASLSFKLIFPEKWHVFLKNVRPERVLYYVSLFALGIGFGIAIAYHYNLKIAWNWVDILSLVTLLFSVTCAWISAAFFNDITDRNIDAVSNPDRPIPSGGMTVNESRITGILFLLTSYLAAFLVGTTSTFLVIVFSLLAFMYSQEPLRLKKIFPLNGLAMSLAALSIIFLGFFFIAPAQTMQAFPMHWILFLLLFFLLICPVRDIKDIEGDKIESIQTIPVMFGEKRGRKIIAASSMVAVIFIFPLCLNDLRVFILSLPLGLYAFYILVTKKHPERSAFSIFFVLMTFVIIYLFKY